MTFLEPIMSKLSFLLVLGFSNPGLFVAGASDMQRIESAIQSAKAVSSGEAWSWRWWRTGLCNGGLEQNHCVCPYGKAAKLDVSWPDYQRNSNSPCYAGSRNREVCSALKDQLQTNDFRSVGQHVACEWVPFVQSNSDGVPKPPTLGLWEIAAAPSISLDLSQFPYDAHNVADNYGLCVSTTPSDAMHGQPKVYAALQFVCFFYSLLVMLPLLYMVLKFLVKRGTSELLNLTFLLVVVATNEGVFKNLISQRRPEESCANHYGMPSGHSTVSYGLLTMKLLQIYYKMDVDVLRRPGQIALWTGFRKNRKLCLQQKVGGTNNLGAGFSRVHSRRGSEEGGISEGGGSTPVVGHLVGGRETVDEGEPASVVVVTEGEPVESPRAALSPLRAEDGALSPLRGDRTESPVSEGSHDEDSTSQDGDQQDHHLLVERRGLLDGHGATEASGILRAAAERRRKRRNDRRFCCNCDTIRADMLFFLYRLKRVFCGFRFINDQIELSHAEAGFWTFLLCAFLVPIPPCRVVLRDHSAAQTLVGIGFGILLGILWTKIIRSLARRTSYSIGRKVVIGDLCATFKISLT